jgi:phospholipid/cholesterol/gamma-HCH transport system ATP-binding protein
VDKRTVEPGTTTAAAAPAGEQPIVELRDVTKRFGRLLVLDQASLKLYRGHTTVVIGESGAGKSVLLKHIVGLLRPDAGEVYVDGQRVDRLRPKEWVKVRRRFGFLFQGAALFDSMTASENVAFPVLEHRDVTEAGAREIALEKLRMVGLEEFADKKPAQLSGGQRKRVGLARAIALDPEVILYDEPTTGLDPVRADVINELILKLQHELGVTGVVVTHDMASAYKVADRIVMLYRGKFIADGTPDEIRSTGDERVRRFVEGRADEEDLASLRAEITK